MKRWVSPLGALAVLVLFSIPSLGAPAKKRTFTGYITDASCGLDHSRMQQMGGMGKDDKLCTLKCVEKGDKFALADKDKKKVYQLSDQEKPKEFAGAKVKVEGTLEGETIQVASIEPAK